MIDDSDREPRYKGGTLNCIRNGIGVYKYPIGGNGLYQYDGPWMNSRKVTSAADPRGKFNVKGLSQVTAEFINGEITGKGDISDYNNL